MEILLDRPTSVKNSYTIFHQNPTNCVVADIRSHTDRWTDSRGLHVACAFFRKELLKPEHSQLAIVVTANNTCVSLYAFHPQT